MRFSILFLLISLLMSALTAQTGMFDLSFWMSRTDARELLLEKGFSEVERTDYADVYANSGVEEMTALNLYFDDDDLLTNLSYT